MLFDMESPAAWVVQLEEARGTVPRVIFQGNEEHARERFGQIKAAMRYGVVSLVDPLGEVVDLMGRAFPARRGGARGRKGA